MVCVDFVLRTCAQSAVGKAYTRISNHLGSRNGKWFRFTYDLQERIKFVNRGLTVTGKKIRYCIKYEKKKHVMYAIYSTK